MTLPICIEQLDKNFDTKQVLRDVNLEIPTGTVLGVLGRNGSGKSTLIKCALGLLRPTGGEARVFGESAWNLSGPTKARLGYVPQEFVSYPWMRVRQVIAYTAAFYPNWNHEYVDRMCQQWQVPLEERVGPLSTGQLQTLGIVLALGHEPELLVLDEPVASLDPSARRQFLQTLIKMIDRPDQTVIFSTHITSDLERVANRLALLQEGTIAYHGELDQLKERVKRLHVTARNDLPRSFAVPGALSCEVAGNTAAVSVCDFDQQLVDQMRATWDADVSIHDLNLEEIFVEMHHAQT